MQTRRNFFKYIGLASGAAYCGSVTAATLIATSGKSDAVKQIEQSAGTNLSLTNTYGERIKPKTSHLSNVIFTGSGPSYVPGTMKVAQVGMVAGPDGELYLNINGKWRKVVTE